MNLLLTGAWGDATSHIVEIEALGHKVYYLQNEQDGPNCSTDFIEGIVCNNFFKYHAIEQFKNLKFIQLTSAGLDRVPLDYIKEHNIQLYNAKDVYSIPMSEFALCGVLQLYKQSRFFYENQKAHLWEKNRDLLELNGKTVLIVGCGSVGTECAKRFKVFGCEVIGVDIISREDDFYNQIVDLKQLDRLIPQADVLLLTVPLFEQTKHLINKDRLSSMKKSSILVNVSRGGIVDTNALIDVLPNIGGAVLDVFEEEPLPSTSHLWNCENIIITPHNSFVGDNVNNRLSDLIIANLKRNS